MEALVLVSVLVLTLVFAAGVARGVLGVVLQLIVEGPPSPAALVKPALFAGALLGFWLLAPAVVESPAAASLLAFLAR